MAKATPKPERSTALTTNQYIPDVVSPPGATLADLLEERGLTQADLAARTGRPRKTINEIVQGKAALTSETAIQLERVLGVPASFWLAREQQYREHLARIEADERLTQNVSWLDEVPLKELVKRRAVEPTKDKTRMVERMLAFYQVASVAQYREVYTAPQAHFRRSAAYEIDEHAVAAWLRLGEIAAAAISCKPFDAERFREVLVELRALAKETDPVVLVPALQAKCAEVGVAVVFVPEIPGCRASGATYWSSPQKAVVQLSLRGKTNDLLWFNFFHEAGHILLHGKRQVFIEVSHGDTPEEAEANAFARDLLISPEDYAAFVRAGQFDERSITQFAHAVGIAPAIVVGRLQYEKRLPWKTNLNQFKQRYVFRDDPEA